MRKYLYQLIVPAFVALTIMLPAFAAAQAEIPALVRTVIPSGDASGGRIAYTIPLGDNRALKLNVDAGRLVVTISGAIKDQFKIFRMDDGEFVPLECSAGFLGALVGNISCRDVEPGTRLVFARKDLVDRLIPEAAAGGFDELTTSEEELFEEEEEFAEDEDVFDEGEFVAEDKEGSSWFDRTLDFFGFGEEEEESEEFVDEADELFGAAGGDEFAFEGDEGEDVDFFGFGEEEEEGEEFVEEEPSWFDSAVEGVTDFFGFGEEEESEEFVDEADELFGAAGEDEFAFEDEGEFGFAEGEAVTDDGDFAFGEAGEDELVFGEEGEEFPEGEEFVEGEEERLMPRIWRKIRETAETVKNKVADVIIKLYVKPLPLTPEAAEEELLLFDEGVDEDVFIDDSGEFIEEPEAFDAESAPPAATVNQAFQNFINRLGQ